MKVWYEAERMLKLKEEVKKHGMHCLKWNENLTRKIDQVEYQGKKL